MILIAIAVLGVLYCSQISEAITEIKYSGMPDVFIVSTTRLTKSGSEIFARASLVVVVFTDMVN